MYAQDLCGFELRKNYSIKDYQNNIYFCICLPKAPYYTLNSVFTIPFSYVISMGMKNSGKIYIGQNIEKSNSAVFMKISQILYFFAPFLQYRKYTHFADITKKHFRPVFPFSSPKSLTFFPIFMLAPFSYIHACVCVF